MSTNHNFKPGKPIILGLILLFLLSPPLLTPAHMLTNEGETVSTADDVIALHQKGVRADRIISLIRQSSTTIRVSTEAIERLKAAGIADAVIAALREKGQGQNAQQPQPAVEKHYIGEIVSSFQTFHINGDRGNFREDATLKKGFGLDSFSFNGRTPQFFFSDLEGLFNAQNEGRASASLRRLDDFSFKLEFKKYVKYDDQSSSNFASNSPGFLGTNPQFFSLPGDTALRRTSIPVELTYNLLHRIRISGGYEYRSRQGSLLQLLGGSSTNAADFSIPTRRQVDSKSHRFHLTSDFSLGILNLRLSGSVEKLDDREEFVRPNTEGFVFNRDLVYKDRNDATYSTLSAVLDVTPRDGLYLKGGYIYHRFNNNPEWERLNLDRNFANTKQVGQDLRAQLRGHVLFFDLAYVPTPIVSISYQVRQEWEKLSGHSQQARFENPVNGSLTERLLSETGEDTTAHRQHVLFTFSPKKLVFKGSYSYERRSKDFDYLFTPSGLDFLDGASLKTGDELRSDHRVNFDFKYRHSKDTQFFAQYEHRQRDYKVDFSQLIREYFLGNRNFNTDTITIGAKYRASRHLNVVAKYSKQNRDYEVFTALPQSSRNALDVESVSVSLNVHPTQRLFLFGLTNYSKVANKLPGLTREIDFSRFAPFLYLESHTTFIAGTSFLPLEKWRVSVQYQQTGLAGTVQNLLRTATASTEYAVSERLSLGGKYQHFGFRERQFVFDNYNVNLLQAGLKITF